MGGLAIQACSWTVAAPLWMILHVFTSPHATLSPPPASALLVDPCD